MWETCVMIALILSGRLAEESFLRSVCLSICLSVWQCSSNWPGIHWVFWSDLNWCQSFAVVSWVLYYRHKSPCTSEFVCLSFVFGLRVSLCGSNKPQIQLAIFLSQLPNSWDYECAPSAPTSVFLYSLPSVTLGLNSASCKLMESGTDCPHIVCYCAFINSANIYWILPHAAPAAGIWAVGTKMNRVPYHRAGERSVNM